MRDECHKLIEEMPESALEETLDELKKLDEHYRYRDKHRAVPKKHEEPIIIEAIVLNKEIV